MGFKTITIKDEVYNKLMKLKRPKESFSQLFARLAKKQDLSELCGSWDDAEDPLMYEKLKEMRKEMNEDFDARLG